MSRCRSGSGWWWSGALALACVVLAGCLDAHSNGAEPVVAAGPGVHITQDAFRQQYIDYLLGTGLEDSPQLRQAYLQHLVGEALLVREALAEGIAATDAYRFEEQVLRQKLLLDRYARVALYDTLQVTEREVAEAFVWANTKLTVRHLYAPTRAEAEALHRRLEAGATFDELAPYVFDDPALATNGGLLGTVSFDELDPAFEDVAFRLEPGTYSEPVETSYGYSIIQVDAREQTPMLTQSAYAEKRGALERFVRRRKQLRVRDAHTEALAERLAPRFEDGAVERLYGQISGTAVIADDEAFADWLEQPLVTFGPEGDRRTWTVEDFRQEAQYTDPRQRAQVRTRADVRAFATGLIVRAWMTEAARDLGLDDEPVYDRAVQQALADWVAETRKAHLRAEAAVPEDSVRAFYAEAAGDYAMPARVRVWEIAAATEAQAEALRAELRTTDFAELARRRSLRPGAAQTGGDLGFLTREQLGAAGEAVFAAAEGDVVGPVPVGPGYALLRVGERQPERPMTFDEARPYIEQLLQATYGRAALREHLAALRAQFAHELTIHDDRVATMPLVSSPSIP